MALDDTTTSHPLACGRDVDRVRVDLERGRWDDHEQQCAHCSAAARSLRALQEATEHLRRDPAEPSANMLTAIMDAVRAEIRRETLIPLHPTDPTADPVPEVDGERAVSPGGQARIAVEALAAVLRYTADTVEGVRARGCSIVDAGLDHGGSRPIRIELSVAVLYHSVAVPDLLIDLRRRLIAAAEAHTGLRVEAVDLVVEDVYRVDP